MKAYICFCFVLFFGYVKNSKKMNVLLIVVDDLRSSIRAYGDVNAFTPNIDQLAREGVLFQNAYAQQSLCAPSRNSFLTSRRPDTLHLYDFYNFWRVFVGNFTTLPQYFKENHYYTKSIGKVFHPGISSNFTDDYPLSWSEPPWHPPTEIYKNSAVCHTKNGWFANLICPVKTVEQPKKTLPDLESVKEAIKFLRSYKNKNKPFFLAVGFHKPHVPLKFPKKYKVHHKIENIILPGLRNYPPGLPTVAWNSWNDIRWREDIASLNLSYPFGSISDVWAKKIRQAYFACVSYIDDLVGQLLLNLKAANMHKNTIVALLGDNGWSLGEHGEWSKYSNFDIALKVPLIFRIPNITYYSEQNYLNKTALEINEIVELVDLFPTLVDLAGLKPISKCPKNSSDTNLCTEGVSLLPLINNKKKSRPLNEKNYALSQYPRPQEFPSRSPDSDKPKLHQIKIMGYSIRTERYRYTEWISWNYKTFQGNWTNIKQTEFYDHHIDPNENLNLAGRPGLEEVQQNLANMLRKSFGVDSKTKRKNTF